MTTKNSSNMVFFGVDALLEISNKNASFASRVIFRADSIFANRSLDIKQTKRGLYLVQGSEPQPYKVSTSDCECFYWSLHRFCKHVTAVQMMELTASLIQRDIQRIYNKKARKLKQAQMPEIPLYEPFVKVEQNAIVEIKQNAIPEVEQKQVTGRIDKVKRWLVRALGGVWA